MEKLQKWKDANGIEREIVSREYFLYQLEEFAKKPKRLKMINSDILLKADNTQIKVILEGITYEDKIPAFFNNDSSDKLGHWENISIEDNCLYGDLYLYTNYDQFKGKGISVGLKVEDCEIIDELLNITKSTLLEASLSDNPLDKNTII